MEGKEEGGEGTETGHTKSTTKVTALNIQETQVSGELRSFPCHMHFFCSQLVSSLQDLTRKLIFFSCLLLDLAAYLAPKMQQGSVLA